MAQAPANPFDEWTKDEEGNLTFFPITGFGTAIIAKMGCSVRIEFARSLEQIGKKPDSIQLAMTPMQAKELGEALLAMEKRIDLNVPPGSVMS